MTNVKGLGTAIRSLEIARRLHGNQCGTCPPSFKRIATESLQPMLEMMIRIPRVKSGWVVCFMQTKNGTVLIAKSMRLEIKTAPELAHCRELSVRILIETRRESVRHEAF